ncbi:site-specific DNA-methyltransferase [Metamycoplasma hyosynoviae]|uniref:DNA-methyltransferase n=1 Tax=Metamycoplasma hyosynoviae TaxID=29559 RepID=UPI002366E2EC|nr:site-specific DNA-methyltransferase [Metamycoplasma hyosynoviae]MDD7897227.1 site-specific DNA-methyltransferase [Metamycoplasma hyosynoviae]
MKSNRIKIDKTNFDFKQNNISNEILTKLKENKIIKDFYLDGDFCLINGECIEVMNALIKQSIIVDHIITDIPYGTVQGLSIEGWKNKSAIPQWDIVIDKKKMFDCCFKISKPNTNILLFSQEPLTYQLITEMNNYEKFSLSNKMMWVKNNHANGFNSKTTPLNYYEEILLIRKSLDENNSIELRKYFGKLLEAIPDSKKEIMEKLGQGLDHCFRFKNRTFYIPTLTNYNKLIETYAINNLDFFKPYIEINRLWKEENTVVFNIPNKEKIFKNVLEFKKDTNNIHPTQKPQELLKTLINVFSEEGDTILDFTSGSGSTGIACITLNRKFIGIELDSNFYEKSIRWYQATKNKQYYKFLVDKPTKIDVL